MLQKISNKTITRNRDNYCIKWKYWRRMW